MARGERCELGETLRRVESGAAPDDVPAPRPGPSCGRPAAARRRRTASGVDASRLVDREVDWAVGHHGLAGNGSAPRTPGCSVATNGPSGWYWCSSSPPPRATYTRSGLTVVAPASSWRPSAAASRGARSRPSGDSGSTTSSASGTIGEERDERRGPSRHGERRRVRRGGRRREAVERHRADIGAGEHHPAAALGDRLVGAGGQDAVTDGNRARSSNRQCTADGLAGVAIRRPRRCPTVVASRAHRMSSMRAVIDSATPKATRKATVWLSSNAAPNA